MKKENKILIVLVVMIIILLIVGGIFAYAYIATDLLKNDAELFFKYLSQITEEDGFIDKNIEEFQEKKKQNPYENSGKFTITAELPEELGTVVDKVNDLSINFSGKVDSLNNKVEQDIEIDYGKGITFPITYKQDNDKYGLKINRVSSKFVAIKNENLKQFAQKLGMNDVSKIPNKIELTETKEKLEFTQEELEQLKQIYSEVLNEQLTKENFSKVKTLDGESYTLQLSGEQLKNVIIKMLEATKQNTLLLDKVNTSILQESEDAETLTTKDIDEMITNINDEYASEILDFKVTLTQKNKKLNQIECEYGSNKITIAKVYENDQLTYSINLEANGTQSSSETEDSFDDTNTYIANYGSSIINSMQLNLYMNVKYTGLQGLSNVQEKNQIGFEIGAGDVNFKYEYNFDNDVQFKDQITIDSFDNNATVVLNNYDSEVITNFITQLGEKILEINKEQMQELGLEEIQNPLMYSNPIISLGIFIYNTATDAVESGNMGNMEKNAFNAQFSNYEGVQTGSKVNAMLITIMNNNIQYQDESRKIVKVTLDGEKIITGTETTLTTRADTSKKYNVEVIYGNDGLITEIKITTNN